MKYILKHKIEKEFVVFGLYEKLVLGGMKSCLSEDWLAHDIFLENGRSVGRTVISAINELERHQDESRRGHEIYLLHKDILRMPESNLNAIGLPPAIARASINVEGNITGDVFRLNIKYANSNGKPIRASREGAFLFVSSEPCYRLSNDMYKVVELIQILNDAQDLDSRMPAMTKLKCIMPQVDELIAEDNYLKELRIYYATAFSLDITNSVEGIGFEPVLFEKPMPVDTDDVLEMEQLSMNGPNELLPPDYQKIFTQKRFPENSGRNTYLLERGVYIFCDDKLKDALTIVHEIGRRDEDTKKKFIKNPKVFLRDVIASKYDEDEAELISDSLFVEDHAGYSDRVMDVGLWEAPVLPWIQKSGKDWVPDSDSFGIKVRDSYITIKTDELQPLYDNLKEAQENHREVIEFHKEEIPVDASLCALSSLPFEVNPLNGANAGEVKPKDTPSNERIVLLVRENFEEISYGESSFRKRFVLNFDLPQSKSTPKSYQSRGIEWLQNSYAEGVSGVLLADDMGLGKTFQVLYFLTWLRSFDKQQKILVIAPTGLLKNWEKESEIHFYSPYLGSICRLYASSGGSLRSFKRERSGNDLVYGRPTLDVDQLRKYDWIVVSYETMRDYEHSLGKIRFSCIIFDEIQKLKNPRSLVTKAAKALNGDFRLGMTGTPVENRLSDLHTICDVLRPGFLGSLKDFSNKYEKNMDRSKLLSLKEQIESSRGNIPPFMKRRLKSEILEESDFPKKRIFRCKEEMPQEQANAYQKVINAYRVSEGKGRMLKTIQDMRNISLHPYDPQQRHPDRSGVYGEASDYFELSARTKRTLRILEDIRNRNEKVLIFLDSKKMQPVLKAEISKRFGIEPPYIINGDCHVSNRQKAVDNFQRGGEKFDVLILSPKAAGVGLTLTEANHVIHLSRWWNPAVEDQATDRVYRLGQEKEVYVYFPIAYSPLMPYDKVFDSNLDALIDKKRNLSNDLLAPVVGADLEVHDLEFLISGNTSDMSDIGDIYQDSILIAIDRMGPQEFEKWVCNAFFDAGYDEVNLTSSTNDQGVDVCTRRNGRKGFVQVKHTFNVDRKCSSNPVVELGKAYDRYGDEADYCVITNHQGYNQKTEVRAEELGVNLYARFDLKNLSELLRKPADN